MKKIKIGGVFFIFVLSVISHFAYELFPNNVFSILFPVNESIWEHMKLLVTPVLLFCFFEYFIMRKKNIYYSNFILSYGISIIVGIIFYLIIYLPIHYTFGHNMIVSIVLLIITFIIIEIISYKIMNSHEVKNSNIIGLFLIILIYIIFGLLTYFPIKIDLFFDNSKNIYGVVRK